jgi:OOP family OmpA-OmpF porin
MRHPSRLLRGLLALAVVPVGTALANGGGAATGIPGYLIDSGGTVVRSSAGDCWHTSEWTPALATVVGCDGVMAKAVPVPAPAISRAAPSPKAAPEAAPAPTAETPPAIAAVPAPAPAPETRVAPESAQPAPPAVVPVPSVPSASSTGLAPDESNEAQKDVRSEKVTLDTDTYFDFDKATLKPEGRSRLDELANRLSSMRLEVVVATGHTDSVGTKKYNQGLSLRRAQAVKTFLEEKGLPVEKIFTTGKGEAQPIATNKSRAGRAKNRRVEVEVVGLRETP